MSSKEERMESASQIYSRDHDCRVPHVHWLVLRVDRSRRLLALHHRLEPVPTKAKDVTAPLAVSRMTFSAPSAQTASLALLPKKKGLIRLARSPARGL